MDNQNPSYGYCYRRGETWIPESSCFACGDPSSGYRDIGRRLPGNTEIHFDSTMIALSFCYSVGANRDECGSMFQRHGCRGSWEPVNIFAPFAFTAPSDRWSCNANSLNVRCQQPDMEWVELGDGYWTCHRRADYNLYMNCWWGYSRGNSYRCYNRDDGVSKASP